ncbi:MAG TPA: DUF2807 domain-containing protein [Anaerolineae bacterium]|nr:DUF2807 domain-containing protein [Anaerolineae bacterium]HOQ97574.1 DUF2807 domain-containing protein [Anaerolineae bacterium]HPL28393.1 DUF2807 domain-containing protein [Anaerolineae bacterium]
MRTLIVSLALVSVLLLAGCTAGLKPADGSAIRGSGVKATREYAEAGFTALDIDSAFVVTVTQGDGFKLTVTADDNLLDYVRVTQSQGTLRITIDSSGFQSFSSTGQEAAITMPRLTAVRLGRACRATLAGFAGGASFAADLGGASRLSGDVQANDIRLDAHSASQLDLTGRATSLTLSADGASSAKLGDLAVEKAGVTLRGASQATVAATSSLSYDLNDASQLTYSGNPTIGTARSERASKVTRQ